MAKGKVPQLAKISTLAFSSPYWELAFRGKLNLGKFAVKTCPNDHYAHRGLVLCYTSLKNAEGPLHAHDIVDEAARRLQTVDQIVPRGVVGCAELVDLRELTDGEKKLLFKGYNNVSYERFMETSLPESERPAGNYIFAMHYGYFLKRTYRFPNPFVPPQQFMYGPRGKIPAYAQILEQLPEWAVREVYKLPKAA